MAGVGGRKIEKNLKKSTPAYRTRWLLILTISAVAIGLAHNILSMILIPAGFAYFFWRLRKHAQCKDFVLILCGAFGMTMFFWIPMLAEKHLTVIDGITKNEYADHFPTFRQFVYTPVEQGFSVLGPDDSISLSPSVLSWVVLILAIIMLIRPQGLVAQIDRNSIRGIVLIWLVVAFLILPISIFVWTTLPFLQYIQFSWRFLGNLTFLSGVLGAFIFEKLYPQWRWMLVGMSILLSVLSVRWPILPSKHFPAEYYLNYYQTSTIWDDVRPKSLKVEYGGLSPQQPLIEGRGSFEMQVWKGVYRMYTVTADEVIQVTEPTAYFPGWEVEANGQKLELQPEKALGQIHYSLGPGEYQIRTRFTQNTPPRFIGNTLTVLSGVFVLIWINLIARGKNPTEDIYKKMKKRV